MARKATEKKQAGKSAMPKRAAIACLVLLGVIYFPTAMLLCGCMLPAFVAALVDNKADKTAGLTVGAVNLAGTIPACLELWANGGGINEALALLLQPRTLLLAYAAAAFGWMLYLQVPGLVSGILVKRSQQRVADIDRRLQELQRKWGAQIAAEVQAPLQGKGGR